MSRQCCDTCIFYRAPKAGAVCGQCNYPVPEWLRVGSAGGGFISSAEYSGQECAVYKDVIAVEPTSNSTDGAVIDRGAISGREGGK